MKKALIFLFLCWTLHSIDITNDFFQTVQDYAFEGMKLFERKPEHRVTQTFDDFITGQSTVNVFSGPERIAHAIYEPEYAYGAYRIYLKELNVYEQRGNGLGAALLLYVRAQGNEPECTGLRLVACPIKREDQTPPVYQRLKRFYSANGGKLMGETRVNGNFVFPPLEQL